MRNISFSLTTPQFIDGSKDVTRRFGWWNLEPGDRLMAVEKGMGLKLGEKVRRLGVIEIISVRVEPLARITQEDCVREGFPHLTPAEFAMMLSPADISRMVNRIEFKRVRKNENEICD